jgi:predicted permease
MFQRLISRARGFVRRRRSERELDAELRFHLEMEMQANIGAGMSPEEARRVALRDLGGMTQTREAVRDVRSNFMESLVYDLRYALRTLKRSPAFTIVAAAVLALGIGANTAVFSLVNAILFRQLPVANPEQLRYLYESVTSNQHPEWRYGLPYRDFTYLQENRGVFDDVAGFTSDLAKMGHGADVGQVRGESVSTNYFDLLGVKPVLGRAFAADDDLPAATPAVVISDALWHRRFNADPNVVGKELDLRALSGGYGYYSRHERTYKIVGVMPPGFSGISSAWEPAEFWTTLLQRASDRLQASQELIDRPSRALEETVQTLVVARLRPGATDLQAMPAVLATERNMLDHIATRPTSGETRKIVYGKAANGRLPFDSLGRVVPARLAMALFAVAGMVLLIAATNLVAMLLARGLSRRAEVGVRLALGAGRARVGRQVLSESLLLSLMGAAVGLVLARVLVRAFLAFMPGSLDGGLSTPRAISLSVPLDLRVLLFTAAVSVGAGLLVGLLPALQALRTSLLTALVGGSGPTPAAVPSRARHWTIVPQICLSLVLLLAAGALVRTVLRAEMIDRGFEPGGLVYGDFALPMPPFSSMSNDEKNADSQRRRLIYQQMLERARTAPGIIAAALTMTNPWGGRFHASVVSREDYASGRNYWVNTGQVSAGYFEAMRMPILRGRSFDGRDTIDTTPVAIVCQGLARKLWPGQDPIGRYIANWEPNSSGRAPIWMLVVGVVKEVKAVGREDSRTFFFYTPLEQQRSAYAGTIVVRGHATTREVSKALAGAITAAAPEAEVAFTRTMDAAIGEAMYPRRLAAAILGLSGLIGLLLSSIGLYGLVSYSAAQRLHEIGVRAALGAEGRDIILLMLRDGMLALGVGVVCGIGLGIAGVRVVSSTVVAIPSLDVLTLVAVPTFLSAVILTACLLPARRAARVNPIDVLRGL